MIVPRIRVTFRPRRLEDRVLELPAGARVRDLLAAVGQPASSTLAVRGRDPIGESEALVDGEEILLLSSFSGG